MKTSLKKKILEMYYITWVPFLFILIFIFYLLISQQLDRLRIESLKTQSYQSQMYAIQYLKGIGQEKGENNGLEKLAGHFAKYISSGTGYRIQIYNKERMLSDSDISGEKDFPITKDIATAFDKKAYTFFYYSGVRYTSFSSPVVSMADNHMGETVGVIRYIYPMHKERLFLIQVMSMICLLSIGILMINIFLSGRNAESITESVNALKQSVVTMQNGNLTQSISIGSGDEMEELAQAFDIMRSRLKEYIARLDDQSEQMQKFYNNVAHQLKTPLTSIIGYSQMIQLSDDLDSICEDAFIIEESGEKLLKSIDIILNGVRREGLYASLHISRFLLSDVIEDAIRLLKPRLDRMQVSVENKCEKAQLQTDREKLLEITLTLIDNALIHSECKNIVFFSAKIDGKVYLHIKDDGRGISRQDAEHIFNAFYQGKFAKGSGSGLGLSICYSLAKDLQSHLKLFDCERGAEFVMEIPNLQL